MKHLVKICGITKKQEILALNQLKPDYIGMVLFFPKSKRNLTISQAKDLLQQLDASIQSVAVVVSPTLEQLQTIQSLPFSAIQIHGNCPLNLLEQCKLPIIKALQSEELASYDIWCSHPAIKGFVFDAAAPGSGQIFDWNQLSNLTKHHHLWFLAGGLSPDNLPLAKTLAQIDVFDVSSGVENEDGTAKDLEKVADFIQIAHN